MHRATPSNSNMVNIAEVLILFEKNMSKLSKLATQISLAALCLFALPIHAQNYPTQAIKIVVGFSPGGVPDIAARVIGQQMSENWKQPVVVENKLGAGSNIAAQAVANAAPDGYTLLSISSAFAISPAIYSSLPFDPIKDFSGVTLTSTGPALVLISPNLKINTIKELVDYAAKNPGKVTYSSAGVGSGAHFAAELLQAKAGLELLHIPTKGIPDAITEVMSGRVDFFISPYASAINLVRSGKVKAIAITSTKRFKDLPTMPTVSESGIPGYQWEFWYGLMAPAKTPKPILQKIALEVKRILELPNVKERFDELGTTTVSNTPEQFDKFIATEIADFARLAKQSGIKPQ
jgi:tripartite-type tricarboxylate transporter receptor subunit TctC